MNIRLTLIALVLAVAAGIFAIIKLNAPSPSPGPVAGSGARLLDPATFDPEKVTRIAIEKADGERYVFEKTGDEWWQTEPARFAMVAWSIRMLATSAADLTISQTIRKADLKGDLAADKLGLDPAMATVTFDTADTQVRIHLGRISVGEKAYARLTLDGDVHIVEDKLHRRVFENSPREWRVKNLFTSLDTGVSRLTIERSEPGKTVSLVKTSGRWRLALPIDTHADEQAVTQLIGNLGAIQVESFVEDAPTNLADYGLASPWATITAETDKMGGEGKTTTQRETVLLGNAFDLQNASRYAKRGEQAPILKVRANDVKTLTPEPASLVSRTVVLLPRSDIRAVVVDGQEGRFRLERQQDEWMITLDDGSTAAARTDAVAQLLDQVTLPCTQVEIAARGAPVEDSYLGKVAVEGFSNSTVAEVTWYRRQAGEAATIVFADGSGALRSRPLVNVPELIAESFLASTPTGGGGVGVPDVEPTK